MSSNIKSSTCENSEQVKQKKICKAASQKRLHASKKGLIAAGSLKMIPVNMECYFYLCVFCNVRFVYQ